MSYPNARPISNNFYSQPPPRPYMMDGNNYRPQAYPNRPVFDPRVPARPMLNNGYPMRPTMNGYRPPMAPYANPQQPGNMYHPRPQNMYGGYRPAPPVAAAAVPPPPPPPPPSSSAASVMGSPKQSHQPIVSSGSSVINAPVGSTNMGTPKQPQQFHSRSTSIDSRLDFSHMNAYPPSIRQNMEMSAEPESLDWGKLSKSERGEGVTELHEETGCCFMYKLETTSQVSYRPTHAREGSIMTVPKSVSSGVGGGNGGYVDCSGIQRLRSNVNIGRSRYRDSYMATSFKAIEPPPQPRLILNDPADQAYLADLAGRQMTPLKGRSIPFELYDSDNKTILTSFNNLAQVLRFRALKSERTKDAFTLLDNRGKEPDTLSWDKLNARAQKIAQTLSQKGKVRVGDRVALIYRKSEVLEFIPALLGCFLAGVTAVPINTADDLSELAFVLSLANIRLILTTDHNQRAFAKDMQAKNVELPGNIQWWKTNDMGGWYPSKKESDYPPIHTPDIAYIEYAKATNGELKGVTVTHNSIMEQCAAFHAASTETIVNLNGQDGLDVKPRFKVRQPDVVVSYFEPRQQIGLILSVLQSIYTGNLTILLSGSVVESPAAWIYVLSKYQATMALTDYASLKFITQYFTTNPKEIKSHSRKVTPDLSCLRYLIVDTNIVQPELHQLIADKLLEPLGCTDNPLGVICPILSLPEHGGKIISMRDNLGPAYTEESVEVADEDEQNHSHPFKTTRSVLAPGGSRDTFACLFDAQALRRNRVMVLAAGSEAKKAENINEPDRVLIESFGFCMPKTNVAIVNPDTATLCPPDTLGEIWIDSPSVNGGFWALPKHTESIFHAHPVAVQPETSYPEVCKESYLRTGLCGTIIGGRLFVLGPYEDRIRQYHLGTEPSAEDIYFSSELLATVNKRARIDNAIFEILVKNQHLPVIVCESNISRSELAKLADEVDEALIDFHGLRAYAILFVKENGLPRQKIHGRKTIHPLMAKKQFIYGQLNIRYIKIDVHRTIFNLATNIDPLNNVWLSGLAYDKAVRTGAIVHHPQRQHTGLEQVRSVIDERTDYDVSRFTNIVDILQWRTKLYPEEVAFTLSTLSGQTINTKTFTWRKVNYKSAAVAAYLSKRGLTRGKRVLILIPFGIDYVFCMYACLAMGVVPVPIEPVEPQLQPQHIHEFVEQLIESCKDLSIAAILTNSVGEDVLKSNTVKAAYKQLSPNGFKQPETINVSKASKQHRLLGKESGFTVRPEWITSNRHQPALITMHNSSDGRRLYAHLSHDTILNQCRTQKMTCQMRFQRGIVTTGLGTYDGLGLLHALFCGVYVGCSTVMIPSTDFYTNPASFFESLQRHKAKDAFLTNALVQFAMNRMHTSDSRHIVLKGVQNIMLANDNRPKPLLYQHMVRYFARYRLDKESINTVYSHVANPMITTRSYMLLEPIALSVDPFWLRQGIVRAMSPEEEPHGILLNDSGIVPSNTMIAIVNPETCTLCPSHVVGEIWVSSDSNAKTFYGLDDASHAQRFEASIAGQDPHVKYVRTGDLGFLWNVRRRMDHGMQPMLEEGQCLYVLGPMSEAVYRSGLIHYPLDVELSIERCHPMIPAGGSIVFQYKDDVVAVVSIKSNEHALSAVPLVVNAVLEHHSFLVDVVVIVQPNHFPRSRYGDKVRRKALSQYVERKLTALCIKRITTHQQDSYLLSQWTQSQLSLNDMNETMSVRSMRQAPSIPDLHSEFDRQSPAQTLIRQNTIGSSTSYHTEYVPQSPL
ncbi:Uncharacterized protein C56F8.02 [Choanephora cucurbitarum]|uniref:Uncharacterized protein C56F8.02 n=1 Tax=Choanephora cucurbitarum TaxID=101091 RepID=A0A1C7N6P6_9FUNG|nr:Uncharacterized protein C56F8.02 [Choanephora cucurbitarum]